MAAMFEFGPGGDIDPGAGAALHAQISDAIRARIVSGEWPRDHRLLPEPRLAEEIGVSRGTFVTETLMEPATAQKLSTLSEDFASQGITLDTRVLSCDVSLPPFAVARLLHLDEGVPAFRLVRIRSAREVPIALLHNYVRLDLAPGIESLDFEQTTLFGALETRYGLEIGTARRSFSAVAAPLEVAQALALPPQQPVQYLEQVTLLADGRVVEYSDVWIDSRQLRVVTHMSRRSAATEREFSA